MRRRVTSWRRERSGSHAGDSKAPNASRSVCGRSASSLVTFFWRRRRKLPAAGRDSRHGPAQQAVSTRPQILKAPPPTPPPAGRPTSPRHPTAPRPPPPARPAATPARPDAAAPPSPAAASRRSLPNRGQSTSAVPVPAVRDASPYQRCSRLGHHDACLQLWRRVAQRQPTKRCRVLGFKPLSRC